MNAPLAAAAAAEEPGMAAVSPPPNPAHLLRMTRGFSCLFWSLPLLAAVNAATFVALLPVRWAAPAWLACFAPLACGLWLLRGHGNPGAHVHRRMAGLILLALVAAGLSPFWAWWRFAPLQLYFAANAGLHYLAMIGLLAGMNRLARVCAGEMGDAVLRREAMAGQVMVLWLSLCTVGALLWLFHRAGLFADGVETVLLRAAQLPNETNYLFLLPYAMTAYVMWRAKESGFRHAARTAGKETQHPISNIQSPLIK